MEMSAEGAAAAHLLRNSRQHRANGGGTFDTGSVLSFFGEAATHERALMTVEAVWKSSARSYRRQLYVPATWRTKHG